MRTSDTVLDRPRPHDRGSAPARRRWPRPARRALALTVVATTTLAAGCGAPPPASGPGPLRPASSSDPAPSSSPATSRPTASDSGPGVASHQLPRGGRTLFPTYRLVGYVGHPGAPALGRLGIGDLDARAQEAASVADRFAAGRRALPVLELISTMVSADPGADDLYRTRTSDAVIARYLAAARKVRGILLLGIQPGRADFLDEVRHYARWLAEPDVGVALDPEWAMGPREVPMRTFGHTTGREIDAVAAYLSQVVTAHDLPDKALVFHQLAPRIVRSENDIRAHRGVAVVKSVDGIGDPDLKRGTYRELTARLPRTVHAGFKLFYDEDRRSGPLMTAKQVLALRPQPEYVLYE